jgi:hypothetical protein
VELSTAQPNAASVRNLWSPAKTLSALRPSRSAAVAKRVGRATRMRTGEGRWEADEVQAPAMPYDAYHSVA